MLCNSRCCFVVVRASVCGLGMFRAKRHDRYRRYVSVLWQMNWRVGRLNEEKKSYENPIWNDNNC